MVMGSHSGKSVWKMPTGLLMAREDIGAAAEREVLEVQPIQLLPILVCLMLHAKQGFSAPNAYRMRLSVAGNRRDCDLSICAGYPTGGFSSVGILAGQHTRPRVRRLLMNQLCRLAGTHGVMGQKRHVHRRSTRVMAAHLQLALV